MGWNLLTSAVLNEDEYKERTIEDRTAEPKRKKRITKSLYKKKNLKKNN
jgi:hypothetical protein